MLKNILPLITCCVLNFIASGQTADNTAILSRKQVPILCYHQIRDWRPSDRQIDKDYIIPPATFKAHIKMLADSGYHTILPDQLYDYLTKGAQLPSKPIMITFDDTDGDQYNTAKPELLKYGFKAVYFIVFNNINKNKYYMTRPQLRQLSDEGNAIECHTLTHANFKKFKGDDWNKEVVIPKQKLEKLTGKEVKYFAYPYGLWNAANLPMLHKLGFLAAFQLTEPRDSNDPIMTIRRLIDCGYWNTKTFDWNVRNDFGRGKSNQPAKKSL